MSQPLGAVCEMPISETETCGILAVRRCDTCKRAFCRSHQAHGVYEYVNQCMLCQVAKKAETKRHQGEIDAAIEYITSGAARAELLRRGVQRTVEVQITSRVGKKGRFGRWHDVDQVNIRYGWIVGEFEWNVPTFGAYGHAGTNHYDILITAIEDSPEGSLLLLRKSAEGHLEFVAYFTLAVHGKPPEFRLPMYSHHGSTLTSDDDWIAMAQAVRRLVGL